MKIKLSLCEQGFFFFILKQCFLSTTCAVETKPNPPSTFTDIISSPQDFGYSLSQKNGPLTWGQRYSSCSGKRQSPVDVMAANEVVYASMPTLQFDGLWDVRKDGLILQNSWNSVEVKYTGEPPRMRGGPLKSDHVLSTINFHWGTEYGSEHAFDKYHFGMEMHLIFYKKQYGSVLNASKENDGMAIVALFLMVSQQNNAGIAALVTGLRGVAVGGASLILPDDAMDWMRRHLVDASYFTYQGSLTIPPCSEIVTWIVLEDPAYIGLKQIREFQRLRGPEGQPILENRRPIQPLNGRQIFYCSVANQIQHDLYYSKFFILCSMYIMSCFFYEPM